MKYDRLKMASKPIPIKIDEALMKRIVEVSEKMGEPRSTVMRIAMRIGLDQLEEMLWKEPDSIVIRTARADEQEKVSSSKIETASDELLAAALEETPSAGESPPPPGAKPAGSVAYGKAKRKRAKVPPKKSSPE